MHAIEIKGLKKTYANGVEALKGINLCVKAGDFFALLGANGAGKSTTIGLISTLLTKTSGSISICGYDIDKETTLAKRQLGLVPQEINLNVFETCEQTLLNQAGYYGLPRKAAREQSQILLKQLGLWEKRHNITRHLSGGMKRRLMIARALIHKPRVLILDEPTAGVDVEVRRSMWDFLTQINQEGTTIILTTHYLEEAEHLCKNIAIINQGQIIQNTSMRALLSTLSHQTYVLSTSNSINILPKFDGCSVKMLDSNTFELRIEDHQSLNDIFEKLNHAGIQIYSLRNKTNRLEELFMDLIHHDD
jgi:ABC-2 type transport system ATP-binding protein